MHGWSAALTSPRADAGAGGTSTIANGQGDYSKLSPDVGPNHSL